MSISLATVSAGGGYFSLAKIIAALVLMLPWWFAAPWVHKDAKKVHASQNIWGMVVLWGGALGVLLILLVPFFVVGLLMYMVLAGAVLIAYVVYRNGRVEPEEKILTARHLSGLLARKKRQPIKPSTRVKVYDSQDKIVRPPDETAEQKLVETYNATQELLYDMIWRRASQAVLVPDREAMTVRYVIDGAVTSRPQMPLEPGQAIVQYVKPLAGLNVEEYRRPQKGAVSVDVGSKRVDMAIATAGTTGGQRIQFRILQEAVRQNLDELGMSEQVLKAVKQLSQSKGLIIVSGRSSSGVTSTLYSLLRQHDAFMKQLLTMESKPAVPLENITQTAYGEPSQLADALAPALRRDPDVIMIDQCPDAQTAQMIVEAAAEKSILLGMHAEDSFVALAKWVKVCGDAAAAVANLNAVLCQMLLRRLCPTCKEPYRPDPQMLVKANLPSSIEKFFRPPTQTPVDDKGQPIICATCQATGYFERTGAFELLVLTRDVKQLVAQGAGLRDIKSACRKRKMLYLQEQALRKVIEGTTSVQEVLRVSQQAKKT